VSDPAIPRATQPWHQRLSHLDRRWIFVVLFVIVLVPLLAPVRLPVAIGSPAQRYHDAIEAIPAGSTVLMPFDYDPAFTAEVHPMALATLRRLLEKRVRVVAVTMQPAGPPMADLAWRTVGVPLHKTYGVDFVNLGYKAGNEVIVLALGNSIKNIFPLDSHGTPIAQLPLFLHIDRLGQMQMIVEIAGTSAGNIWVEQGQARFHVPMVAGVTGVMAPEFFPYLQAGQIRGMLGGMAGAAEYEHLLNVTGTATKGMDAQSMAHLYLIALILLGNVIWFAAPGDERRRGKRAAGGAGVAVLLAVCIALSGCGAPKRARGGGAAATGDTTGGAPAADARTEAPADTAHDGHAFVATYDDGPIDQIRIVRDTSDGIVAGGSTGFPDGTRIQVALERPRAGKARTFEAIASTQCEVELGRFSCSPLTPPTGPLPHGPVHVRVSASFAKGDQSNEVLSSTGNGRRFRGHGMHESYGVVVYQVDVEGTL
jgi:hypothetical protein